MPPSIDTPLNALESVTNVFKGFVGNMAQYLAVFEAVDNEFDGSAAQGQAIIEQINELRGYFGDLSEFIDEQETYLQELCDAVQNTMSDAAEPGINADASDRADMSQMAAEISSIRCAA